MDTVETVTVTGENGKPLRINKSDFDANPDNYTLYDAKTNDDGSPVVEQAASGQPINPPAGVTVPVAPSAPASLPNPVAPSSPSVGQMLVLKDGKTYYVCDVAGTKVKDIQGIENDGYKTEAEALAAIKAVAGTHNTLGQ